MLAFLIVLFVLVLLLYIFMHQPPFGQSPSGERLQKIKHSPHYKNGQFQNLSYTPSLTEGAHFSGVLKEFFFGRDKRSIPPSELPSVKTNLSALDPLADILIWFGHSSYYLQLDSKKILVDPVLSGHASPLKFTTRSFKGSDIYKVDELPVIDYLFITHDHWDHLDHNTLTALQPKTKKLITSLGVGAHLERWGYDPSVITEMDWNDEHLLESGFIVKCIPARHFSGRGFKRNGTLWSSFALKTPGYNIFIGGDSGYDGHFKKTGEESGPFDLAILENGQYNKHWKYIHMMPEEVVQAAIDLKAKKLLPVHWSKFSLSIHAWDDPIKRVVASAEKKGISILHPMIGEVVFLNADNACSKWWESI